MSSDAAVSVVNVCSCGSSGSTVLARMLDRHPEVSCGDELFLFATPALYDQFDRVKRRRWLARVLGVSGNPYHQGRAIFRNVSHYGMSHGELWKLLGDSDGFRTFVLRLRDRILTMTGKRVWAEKTPRNVRLISHFFKAFPDGRMVVLVRDPRDVIASLRGRGKGITQGIEAWMRSVACIAPWRGDPRVCVVRYEDLCRDANAQLERICRAIGAPFEAAYFADTASRSQGLTHDTEHDSWQNQPGAGLSTESIGRYREADVDFEAVARARLTESYAALLGTERWTVGALARSHGYDLTGDENVSDARWTVYQSERRRDPVRRWFDRNLGVQPYRPVIEYDAERPPEPGVVIRP